ncbi:kappa-casein [Prionailurus iriomotensis]
MCNDEDFFPSCEYPCINLAIFAGCTGAKPRTTNLP